MLKIQTIVSSLQDFSVMHLDASNTEYIYKDQELNRYVICHPDVCAGLIIADLKDLKEFIKQHEKLFIDKFSANFKYNPKDFSKAVKSEAVETEEACKVWLKNNTEPVKEIIKTIPGPRKLLSIAEIQARGKELRTECLMNK